MWSINQTLGGNEVARIPNAYDDSIQPNEAICYTIDLDMYDIDLCFKNLRTLLSI